MSNTRILVMLTLTVLFGCEDPPEVQVDFPTANAQFSGEGLSIRGRFDAADAESVEVSVDAESGGLDADVDTGNKTWSIRDFQLTTGIHDLVVSGSITGNRRISEVTLNLDTRPNSLRMTGIAEVEGRVYISDARLKAVITVDAQDGNRSIVSGPFRGSGPLWELPAYLQSDGTDLYVLDGAGGAIFRLNTLSGDRSLISGEGKGGGPLMIRPRVFALVGDEILLADGGLNSILRISTETGDREVIFSEIVEGEPVILSPRGIVIDSTGMIFVADDQYRAILSIDALSGEFAVVSGGDLGEGLPIALPRDLQLNQDGRLLLLDQVNDSILAIDPLTGDRERLVQGFEIPVALAVGAADWFIADNNRGVVWRANEVTPPEELTEVGLGIGLSLGSPADVIGTTGGWLIADSANGQLIRIDAATGNRQTEVAELGRPVALTQDELLGLIYILDASFNFAGVKAYDLGEGVVSDIASPSLGEGPTLVDPRQLLIESDRLVVLETITARLLSLDPITGDRTVLASADVGTGESLRGITRFTVDAQRKLIYLLDSAGGRILQLDLATDERTLIFENPDRDWVDIKFDATANRLLILSDSDGFVQGLDLISLTVSSLSDRDRGEGDLPANPVSLEDLSRDLVAVVDAGLDALFLVDLVSGDRIMVSR